MSQTVLDISQAPSNQVNLADNAQFNIWQRGTTFTNPANSTYTADRWFMVKGGTVQPTVNILQDTGNLDGVLGTFDLEVNITNAGSGGNNYVAMTQLLEQYASLKGKVITVTARVKTTMAGVHIESYDGVANAVGGNHSGSGNYETITLTRTVSSTATFLNIQIGFPNSGQLTATGIFYIASVMVTLGPSPAAFVPLHPGTDMARCQRYYTGQTNQTGSAIINSNGSTTNFFTVPVMFHQTMRVSPTVTFSSVVVDTVGIPTNGISSIVDSSNWTLSPSLPTVDGFGAAFSRNAFQGTYDSSFWTYNWTASADL